MTVVQSPDRRTKRQSEPPSSARSSSPARLSGHLPALDGVRGLAILLVLFLHATQGVSSQSPWIRAAVGLGSIGWCGVDLFFVLSGFLITGILHDTKESAHRTRNFYARRSLRIFPLYYGLLIVVFATLPIVLPSTDPRLGQFESMRPWLFLYGTNIFVSIYDKWCILGHFWSLAVEEHFYLVWPLVVFGLSRKAAMRVCGLVVVAALACRLAFIAGGFVLAPYCLTLCRMDSLVIGGFLALAARGEGGLDALAPLGRRVAICCGAVLVPWLCFWPGATDLPNQVIGYPLLDLFFASLLVLSITAPPGSFPATLFGHRALRTLGRYSYGLYVFNSIIVDDLFPHLLPVSYLASWTRSADLASVASAALSFSATLVVAWLSWHVYESRFLKLKGRFAE